MIKTGIKGFDKLVGGGFKEGKAILLSGTPGTGKTIFALQFLYNGAERYKEKGLYITFEENLESIRSQCEQFGWKIRKQEEKGMINFWSIDFEELKTNTIHRILDYVERNNIKRLVVDSLSTLSFVTPAISAKISDITDLSVKRYIYSFIRNIRTLSNTSTLLIAQADEGKFSRDGVSEFICDGIIYITYESMGGAFSRSLLVRKMREVKNDEDIHPLEISPKEGIIVHDIE